MAPSARPRSLLQQKEKARKMKLRKAEKTQRCTCVTCLYTRKIRRRTQRGFRENKEVDWLLKRFRLYHERDKWFDIMYAAIRHCEGSPWNHLSKASTKNFRELFSRCNFDLAFHEEARFFASERDPEAADVTAVLDHTLVETAMENGIYWSGKHGTYGLKFAIVITMQGTIIRVVGPVIGRVHDFKHCKFPEMMGFPLLRHYENDVILADSGYQGVTGPHVLVPFKKSKNKRRTPAQSLFNRRFNRYRARVEHTIGCLKQRFKLFSKTSIVHRPTRNTDGQYAQDDVMIGCFFKLACLLQSRASIIANRRYQKYATCNSAFWRDRASRLPKHLPAFPVRGAPCGCKCFPQMSYEDGYAEIFSKMAENGEDFPVLQD
jgi:hypothetical protein